MEEQFDEFGYHEIATEGVRDLLKSLDSKNKAYEEMWKYLKMDYGDCGLYYFRDVAENLGVVMNEYENKYLGGEK